MAALTITDVDAVRSEGSLKAPTDASGAASDKQIKSAIRMARRRMIARLTAVAQQVGSIPAVVTDGSVAYNAVLAYTDPQLLEEPYSDEYDAFLHAESCFAIAELCAVLNAQQLSDTGIIQSITIGKAQQAFVSQDELNKIRSTWEARANRFLAPYAPVQLDDNTQAPTMFASRKGTFYAGAI